MVKDKLGIKIGSKKEAAWTVVLKTQEESAINSEISKELSDLVIEHAKKRIAEEKEKFK